MLYFDYCASTPIYPEINRLMYEISEKNYANPSSMHILGIEANRLVEQSREEIADTLKVKPNEIIFTSGATESNNIAIFGIVRAMKKKLNKSIHVITSQIEHSSIFNCFKQLEEEGVNVTFLPVNDDGVVSVENIERNLQNNTALVSIMHVNNEIGTIQPVEQIGEILKKNNVLFHVDGVQGFGKLPVKLDNIDLFTISGHKIGGPKGVGLLVVKEEIEVMPIVFGGGQEYEIRSGTLNVPGIVGIAEAIEMCAHQNSSNLYTLHSIIYSELSNIPGIVINTPQLPTAAPHIINFSYPSTKAAFFLKLLSDQGIVASSQSACAAKKNEPSRVLKAMNKNEEIASSSIRVSYDNNVSINEARLLIEGINLAIEELHKIRSKILI